MIVLLVLLVCSLYLLVGEAWLRIARWDMLRDAELSDEPGAPLTGGEEFVLRWVWPLAVAIILCSVDRKGVEKDMT